MDAEQAHENLDRTARWPDASASRVNDLMNSFNVPGLAIALIEGSNIHSKAFGQATIDPPKPCTPDTLFDAASTSKALTAVSVAMLIENTQESRHLNWDTPMSKLLPDDFVMSTPDATIRISIEDSVHHWQQRWSVPSFLSPS